MYVAFINKVAPFCAGISVALWASLHPVSSGAPQQLAQRRLVSNQHPSIPKCTVCLQQVHHKHMPREAANVITYSSCRAAR